MVLFMAQNMLCMIVKHLNISELGYNDIRLGTGCIERRKITAMKAEQMPMMAKAYAEARPVRSGALMPCRK